MDPGQIFDKTKKELRSLLISAPRGVAMPLLAKDYKMVMGKELPYRELGYRNIEQFISSIPDTIRLGHGPAGLTCYAVANAETQQIARFVASQKKPALKKSLLPPAAIIRKPTKMSGFTKKSHFGPANSRPRRFNNAGVAGGYPPTNRHQYIPAGYHVRQGGSTGAGGSNKFGRPFHAKQQAPVPVSNLPPRLMRSSTSTYDATPPSGSSAHLTRPSSTGSLQSSVLIQTEPFTSPVKQSLHVNQNKSGISLIRFPSQQQMVQVKTQPPSGGKLRCVYHWKKEFDKAESVSINQLNKDDIAKKKVCTIGYIASKPIQENNSNYGVAVKRLLFADYLRFGKGLAVLLVFKSPKNIETQEFSDAICQMPEGTKLKVYGDSFVHVNKKKNDKREPGIDVWYYEKTDESLSNGRSRTPSSHGSPTSARSISPPPSHPPTSQMSTSDRSVLDDEIAAVLRGRLNGVYGKRLGKEYERILNKPAPPDIMEYAQALSFVVSEEITLGNTILFIKAPVSAHTTKDSTNVSMATRSAVSAPTTPVSTTVKFVTEKPPMPSTVKLGGPGEVFDVQVVVSDSVVSFYVQRIGEGFSDKFQSMEKRMSAYLSRNAVPPLTALSEDTLYGMQWFDEESGGGEEIWCRVLIRSILKDQNKAYVLCPDFGNSLLVSMSELKDLPREFYELPFQAIHCCLDGLVSVDYIDEGKAFEAFDHYALNKACIAQVMENSGSRASVELIDSESDGKETINSLLLQELCSEAKLTPVLSEPGAQKVPVKFTDIDENGIVTVQLVGPGLNQLEHLMTIINEAYEKPRAANFINKIEVGMLCCAIYSNDNKWYRVVVKEVLPSRKVAVEFVDYGNVDIVEKSKLRKKPDHPLFNLPFQAVKCTLHGLPPPEGQWTDGAIDALLDYIDCDNTYLQVMEPGDAGVGRLPAVKLLIREDEEEEELGDREGEIIDLNDMLLSDEKLFGLRGGSASDLSDVEVAVQTPVTSSTPEKPAGETDEITSNDSSFSKALNTISDGVKSVKLSESVHQNEEAVRVLTKNSVESEAVQVHVDGSAVSPIVNISSSSDDAVVDTEQGRALNGSKNSTNLQATCVSPQLEISSFIVSKEGSDVVGTNHNDDSVQLLEVENVHQLLTPPSSSDSLSIFSPHTPSGSPSGSPSNLGGSSSPVDGSSTHLVHVQSPSGSKMVHSDSSNSLASSGPFSPHTPQSSPAVGSSPVHFLVGSAGGNNSGVGVDINMVKGGLNFAPLELKSTVPVIISWAASPNMFTIQLFNNLNALDSIMSSLADVMNAADPMSNSLSLDIIQPGLVCCAFSDDQWFRVLVLEPSMTASTSSGEVKVEFLDYGGTDRVGLSSLRLLPKEFLELPFQGLSSSLCNISPSVEGQGWSPEALEYFESLYIEKQLFAVVCLKDFINNHVFLLDTMSVTGKILNLGQELATKGFAKLKAP